MEPVCMISDGNPRNLVRKAIEYMQTVSSMAADLLHEKYNQYLAEIDNSPLSEQFETYLSQTPVISFNGAR